MKTNSRDSLILACALLLVVVAFTVDIFVFPGETLPGPPFFVSILIAAYYLSPRTTVGVVIFATALKLTADLIQGTPIWLLSMYFMALVLVGLAGTALAQRIKRETALTQRLRESEEQLRTMANAIPQLAWMARPDGFIYWYNRRWYEYTGTTPEEMEGWGWQSVHDPQVLPEVLERWQQSLATGEPFEMEFPLRRADGQFRWFLTRVMPLKDAVGRVAYWFGTNTDINYRREVEAERELLLAEVQRRASELDAANKELEAFAYSVSHDLRAPLRHIDGFSRILQQTYADKLDEQGQQYLQFLRDGSQKMGQLIDAMLKLSQATRAELRRQPVNLSELAESILAGLHKEQPERQVEITIAPDMIANGDPQLLRIVLENLLGNAWKFTSKRPVAKIEFGVTGQDRKPVYFVKDNGAGFDMTYAEKLFGAFQRLHKAEEYPGTGIGLATVQRIVHRHGGRVWAEGAVDKGATFYFTLP